MLLINLLPNWRESHETSGDVFCFSSDLTVNIGSIRSEGRAPKTMDIAGAQLCSTFGVNRLLRPSPSDRCMDYHVLIWKLKITASKTGAPPLRKKFISDD